MKERDEREEIIVGRAARNVFLFNVALLIFLFMLNLIDVGVTKIPPDKIVDGKAHYLSLGLNYYPITRSVHDNEDNGSSNDDSVFQYDFPLTVSGVVALLLFANIIAFCFYTKRLEKKMVT